MQEFTRDKNWVDRQYEIERQLRAEVEKLGRAMHADAAIVAELRESLSGRLAQIDRQYEIERQLRAQLATAVGVMERIERGCTIPDDDVQRAIAHVIREAFEDIRKAKP